MLRFEEKILFSTPTIKHERCQAARFSLQLCYCVLIVLLWSNQCCSPSCKTSFKVVGFQHKSISYCFWYIAVSRKFIWSKQQLLLSFFLQVIGQFNLGFIIGKLDQDLFVVDQVIFPLLLNYVSAVSTCSATSCKMEKCADVVNSSQGCFFVSASVQSKFCDLDTLFFLISMLQMRSTIMNGCHCLLS